MKTTFLQKTTVALFLTLLFSSCSEYFAPRGEITDRGNSVFEFWNVHTQAILDINLHWAFGLDALLTAPNDSVKQQIATQYFDNYVVNQLSDNSSYGIYRLKRGVPTLVVLIKTNGKSLYELNNQWQIAINLSEGLTDSSQPAPTRTTVDSDYSSPLPQFSQLYFEMAPIPENTIITMKCTDTDTWNITTQLAEEGDHVNLTLKRQELKVLDILKGYQWSLEGTGHYTAYRDQERYASVTFQIENPLIRPLNSFLWESGKLTFTVADLSGEEPSFTVEANYLSSNQVDITYAGSTKMWYINDYHHYNYRYDNSDDDYYDYYYDDYYY